MNHNHYDPELGIASVTTTEGQTVYSLLCNPGTRTPAINASTLAAYSRSSRSIPELLAYRKDKSISAEEVLDRVISDYNHDSVRGLGHLYVAMEGVDCITAMQFFYNHHLQDGQERSTRYQNYIKGGRQYAPYPMGDTTDSACYYEILDYWLDGYEYFYPLVKDYLADRFEVDSKHPALVPRTLDCVRYLIPMGVSTSVGAIQSGREWGKWIDTLSNNMQADLSNAMTTLMKDGWEGYVPEGDILIRLRSQEYADVLGMVNAVYESRPYSIESWDVTLPITDNFYVTTPGEVDYFNGADPLLVHLHLLKNPYRKDSTLHYGGELQELLSAYNWKNEIGPLGSSSNVVVHGVADIGTIKDLQRHRTLPSFIPLLHSEMNISQDLHGESYTIHPYLIDTSLGQEMLSYMSTGYRKIRQWMQCLRVSSVVHQSSKEYRERDMLESRAIKNLLPHGHVTPYIFYGSPYTFMGYVADLRSKPGGHMAYRLLTQAWARDISYQWPLWACMLPPMPTFSRDEFIDRT
jgi:thymidylate synthase ThyX